MKVRSPFPRQLFHIKYSKCAILSACEKALWTGIGWTKEKIRRSLKKNALFVNLIVILLARDGGRETQLVSV